MRQLRKNDVLTATLIVVGLLAFQPARLHAEKDIVDTAVGAGSFKTLVAAVQAADLVDALKSEGPFTVFAPTDEAFAALPKGTVEELLKPENKTKLVQVLTYHVLPVEARAKQVVAESGATTLNGQRVKFRINGDNAFINDARIVKTDIGCSNGVIHVINQVILPSFDNIPTTAEQAGSFNTLLAAAKAAGLVGALSGDGPLTVFAPTDDAFKALPAGTVDSLLKPENKDKLAAILKYHVVAGRVYAEDALRARNAATLLGQSVSITADDSGARVNNAKLLKTDIDATNGVIHVIDAVLLPPQKSVSAGEAQRMIEHVVSRGVHLYNRGHHEACAKVYANALEKMVSYGDQMPPLVMTDLKDTLSKASSTHCPTSRAWALRHCIDRTYVAMRKLNHVQE